MSNFLKKIKENLFTTFTFTFLITISVICIFKEDVRFSSVENKILTQYKNLTIEGIFDKSYMDNLEPYLSDQFLFRNELISFNTNLRKHIFLEDCINNVYFGKDGYLFVKYTNKDYDKTQVNSNVESLNKFKDKYNPDIYMIPSSFEILDDKLPSVYSNIDANALLKDIENIDYVDKILTKEKNEYIYYKTDHHWTTYGAYCLYKEISSNPIEYKVEEVSNDFYGTTHSKININVEPDTMYAAKLPDNITVEYDFDGKKSTIYFDKYLNEKDKYSYYLDGNHAFVDITNNDVENGKVLIIKDSYANCFIPFLINDYKTTHVVDLRYLNLPISTLIKQNNYDKIIVLYSKVNFITDNNIIKLTK